MRTSVSLLVAAVLAGAPAPARSGEADTLRAENQQLRGDLKECRDKSAEDMDRDRRIAATLARAKQDSDRAKEALERFASTLQELSDAKKRIEELERQVSGLETDLAREQGAAKACAADLEKERADAKALAAKAAALEERLAAAEREKALLQQTVAALEKDKAALQAALEAAEKDKAQLREALAAAEREKALLRDALSALEREKASMKDALAELERRKAEADARVAEFRGLLEKFRALIDAGKLRVKIVEGRMVVELATDVLFASGSANLSGTGRSAIAEVAVVLASIADRKFQVEGHTDNDPISTEQFPSNWELASARALTVVKTMLAAGMPSARISAASFGDARPVQSNTTRDGKKANRRIEIVLVPDLSSLPGFDELNRAASAR